MPLNSIMELFTDAPDLKNQYFNREKQLFVITLNDEKFCSNDMLENFAFFSFVCFLKGRGVVK